MPDAPVFVFGIPLIARSAAYDWDVVVHHFNATLGSIFNQTDPNFRVIVACTGRPEVRIPVDERLEFVDVPEIPITRRWKPYEDIVRRRRAILDRGFGDGEAYLMFADADDLVSNRLVAHVREEGHPFGHVVTIGYAFDSKRGQLSQFPIDGDQTRRFDSTCGTSAVLRVNADEVRDQRNPEGYLSMAFRGGHEKVGRSSAAAGRPLEPVPFRAVVYVRNYGSNLSERPDHLSEERRAQRSQLVAAIAKHPLVIDPTISSEFMLGPLMATAGRPVPRSRPAVSVTVAVTTWRRPAGLRQLLETLRPQVHGYPDREIVVVNDGSHDSGYEEILKDFEGLIRYEALPENKGVGAARNRAVALARGDYVLFVDDDCATPPYWIDWAISRLLATPTLDVLAGTTRLLWRKRGFFERVQAHFEILPRPWATRQDIIFVTASLAIRRTLLETLGGFRPLRIGEDSELAGRIALHGARVILDEDWFVRHEPEAFRTKLTKYWRYGFTNVSLHDRTTMPVAFAALGKARRRRHFANAQTAYRRAVSEADGFSSSRLGRLVAILVVTLVRAAYYDGCAAGARARRAARAS